WGDGHAQTAAPTGNYARRLHDLGRDREAEHFARKVLAINRQTFGDDHPYIGLALDNVALILIELDQADQTFELLREAERIHLERSPEGWVAVNHIRQAWAYLALGEVESALELARGALAYQQEREPPRADALIAALLVTGAAEHDAGDASQAQRHFEAAIPLVGAHGLSESPDGARPYLGLGRSLLATGEHERARPHLELAARLYDEKLPSGHWRRIEAETLLSLLAGDAAATADGLRRLEEDRGRGHWRVEALQRLRDRVLGSGEPEAGEG
ncbi:MAG: tetratricopeptide repeat protein, partial [Acidobacteriota bacterium]